MTDVDTMPAGRRRITWLTRGAQGIRFWWKWLTRPRFRRWLRFCKRMPKHPKGPFASNADFWKQHQRWEKSIERD